MTHFRISARLYALVALALVAIAAAMTFSLFQSHDRLVSERKAMLSAMTENAISVFQDDYAQEQAGKLTHEEAQARAIDTIRVMRYQSSGYFFITDMNNRMIMHPIKPALNGTDQSENKDPTGKRIFVEMSKLVAAQGKGVIDYYWPKPGIEAPVLKYSYVAGFKPWGWIVGTGVYSDDLTAMLYDGLISVGIVCAIAALVILSAAFLIVRSVVKPIERLKTAMAAIANEDVSVTVPDTGRRDEIGQMADVLLVLRDSVRDRIDLRDRDVKQTEASELQRREREMLDRSSAQAQSQAMATVGEALERLATGDLTAEIAQIAPEYSKLRDDFNTAVAALNGVIQSIAHSTDVVHDSAGDISEAANNLSRRTEQQAAALEETAAALDEITSTVKNASDRAAEARVMVAETKVSAEKSGDIVRNAVAAMSRIEGSSSRIGQIIGVIDEIAFQTNLLALNAGVEAARAGDAGRGFAVVAQEVRELAQRSASAAKEIKELIRNSAVEVETGVTLVRSTGDALTEIEGLVKRVNEHVVSIATAAREQATGLQEVNVAVNSMDQMTQQNAAMVEETTAASQTLAAESEELKRLLQSFRLVSGRVASPSRRAA